jgi:HPt (histidine-containing phosphotransfer) domain-containing protein
MVTDLKYLQQMTGNDSGAMKEVIELFLHQLADMRAEFDLLLNQKDWLELSRLAHKIKSSSLMMGIEQMSDEMKELEILAKEGKNTEKYPDYLERFITMTNSIEIELKMYLDSSN